MVRGQGELLPDRAPSRVAFYLPQFHAIPENDTWWGEGFTEWTNVRKARPSFIGHDHPRVPSDLGYYDLAIGSTMADQVAMARSAGVTAFCMYFYWFQGRRLLERPLEALRTTPDIDFPYCICWANENWTRRWDGKEHEVLMGQRYDTRTASEVFDAFLPHLVDQRYLRVDGKAVVVVHRADQIPDASRLAGVWRSRAAAEGVGDLHLVASETTPGLDPRALGFDASAEFPPVGANDLRALQWRPPAGLNREFRGRLMSYRRLRDRYVSRLEGPFVRHRGVMPAWDNTARRGLAATVYLGSSPEAYRTWLQLALRAEGRARDAEGLVFINAWNEWAEGAYLEPDASHGRDWLFATRAAVEAYPAVAMQVESEDGDSAQASVRDALRVANLTSVGRAATASIASPLRRSLARRS